MTIFFFNPCRNGDIHVSRTYIMDIMRKLPNNEYYYIQNANYTSGFILKDIPNLKLSYNINNLDPNISILNIGNTLYINTWYGQSNFKYFNESYSKNKADDCSFYILYNIFIDVYKYLDISIESFEYYFPIINYENINFSKIDAFLSNYTYDKNILICNNNVFSGQSVNFSFDAVVDYISDKYKNYSFILTNYSNINKSNIYYTNDIINISSDLNEISYLSNYCDIIVGRGSGPYTFSITNVNLLNPDKTFISFTNKKIISLGLNDDDYKCNLEWSNNYDLENIKEKIIKKL